MERREVQFSPRNGAHFLVDLVAAQVRAERRRRLRCVTTLQAVSRKDWGIKGLAPESR